MYDADPFAARQEVNKRQAKAALKHENTGAKTGGIISDEFSQIPEVKMASPLRELVENAIKKVRTTLFRANSQTSFYLITTGDFFISRSSRHFVFIF